MTEPFTPAQEKRIAEIVEGAVDTFAKKVRDDLRAIMSPPEKLAEVVRGEIHRFAKLEA